MTQIRLKNNVFTRDLRLGRVEQFDQRNLLYPLWTSLEGKRYRSYTWRGLHHFDQGQSGACVAFSLGHELNARPAEVQNVTDQWLRESLYWEAQRIDPWEGGSYPGAEPFYEGTSVLAGVKVLHRMGAFESYRWAFGIDDLILGVGWNGPAVIGITWYEGMMWPESSNFIYPTGQWLGGHAILVSGVNIKEERFLLRNSWGKDWGRNGECYLSFSDMEALLSA